MGTTFRHHVSIAKLAGSDDQLVRVSIDRAVPIIGGLWIQWRRNGEQLTHWEQHGAVSSLLTTETINQMRQTAREA